MQCKALLNGIVKMTIYKDPDVTPAMIQKQIFSGSKLKREGQWCDACEIDATLR